jgi:hypothetical protein
MKGAKVHLLGGKKFMVKYKNFDDIPLTFGPVQLAEILGISKNKAYSLANRPDFPKIRVGKKIVISKKHFISWMDANFSDTTDFE